MAADWFFLSDDYWVISVSRRKVFFKSWIHWATLFICPDVPPKLPAPTTPTHLRVACRHLLVSTRAGSDVATAKNVDGWDFHVRNSTTTKEWKLVSFWHLSLTHINCIATKSLHSCQQEERKKIHRCDERKEGFHEIDILCFWKIWCCVPTFT